jgi:hypothetical protein
LFLTGPVLSLSLKCTFVRGSKVNAIWFYVMCPAIPLLQAQWLEMSFCMKGPEGAPKDLDLFLDGSLDYVSKVVHTYSVERGWSGAYNIY